MNGDVKADVKAAVELWRETTDKTCSCIDCVAVRIILAHVDAEPARIAAAREEQREACARSCSKCHGRGFVMRVRECPYCDDSTHGHECPTDEVKVLCLCGAERIRATPLDATPLADRIAELLSWPCESLACKRTLADVERAEGGVWYCWECWNTTAEAVRRRAEKAEAEVERLRKLLDEHMESDCRAASERDEEVER